MEDFSLPGKSPNSTRNCLQAPQGAAQVLCGLVVAIAIALNIQ